MTDTDKIEAALARAADKAVNGMPEDRAGIFCRNCAGRRRAMYFSEQAWAHEERDCHVCRGKA